MTGTPHIVVNRHTPMVMEVFSRIGNVIGLDTQEVTREAVREADILIVRSETKVGRDLLEGSRVRFVGTVTIGTDHVDEAYLASRGIAFASAPGSNANSVAEYVAAALLNRSTRAGKPLPGTTIGIVGVGNVGSKVVSLARALGMHVLLNDPPLARKTGDSFYRSLDELMEADILTLHVPLTMSGQDRTYHLFDNERIARLKKGAVLVNTSRGPVVESRALHDALSSEHLSAAILDVWEGEPRIDVELLARVLLGTPHIAGYSLDGKLNALRMVYENACGYLGIPADWNAGIAESFGQAARIAIPGNIMDDMEIIRFAVRQAYDIECDDHLLRQITRLPEKERPRYFAELRSGYRVRREFFNRVVELSPVQLGAQGVLSALGFHTEVFEGVR